MVDVFQSLPSTVASTYIQLILFIYTTWQACLFYMISIPTSYVARYGQRSYPTTLLYSSYYTYMLHIVLPTSRSCACDMHVHVHVCVLFEHVAHLELCTIAFMLCETCYCICKACMCIILLNMWLHVYQELCTTACILSEQVPPSSSSSLECSVHMYPPGHAFWQKRASFCLLMQLSFPLGVVVGLPTIMELGPCLWPDQARPRQPSLVPGVSCCDCGRQW